VQAPVKSPVICSTHRSKPASECALARRLRLRSRIESICSKVAGCAEHGYVLGPANCKPIRLRKSVLLSHKLCQMLRSLRDQQILLEPARALSCGRRKSFQTCRKRRLGRLDMTAGWWSGFGVDSNAPTTSWNNAGKYSFDNRSEIWEVQSGAPSSSSHRQ